MVQHWYCFGSVVVQQCLWIECRGCLFVVAVGWHGCNWFSFGSVFCDLVLCRYDVVQLFVA